MTHLDLLQNIRLLLRPNSYEKITFFSPSIRISGKNISFDKKIKTKNKKKTKKLKK